MCLTHLGHGHHALPWLDCDFENMSFSVEHSYYWRRGGNLKSAKTEASAKPLPMHPILKEALLEWRSQSLYNKEDNFVFPSKRLKGKKPLDLASVLKKKIQPAFKSVGILGVGWHTFPPHGRNHAGRDGGTPVDYPRLPAPQQSSCHQQISAGDISDKAVGTGEVGRGDNASDGIPAENNSCPMIVKGRKKSWDVRFSLIVP